MITTQKNEKGFTLIEVLIAMTIGTLLLATAVYTYTKQDSLLRDENSNVKLRDFARLAMDSLVPDIRMAGYGFPPGDSTVARPAQGIDVATVTTLTYKANTDNISTMADQNGFFVTDNGIAATNPVAAGFALGDNVVFFNVTEPTEGESYSVFGISPAGLAWDPGNSNNFIVQYLSEPVLLNKYHTITYTYNAGTQIITLTDDNGTDDAGVDDTTITVATHVSDLTFSYFDANGNALATPMIAGDPFLGDIRRVQISITVVDPIESTMTATLSTNVHLRNMGI